MLIKIPFNNWSKERLRTGLKCATSRTKQYGKIGDTFEFDGWIYKITGVGKFPLWFIRAYLYVTEGCETPDEFELGVRSALPKVNKKHLRNLTKLFVEARYSDHKMTKKARFRALRNLKYIEKSLERSELEPVIEKRRFFRFQKPAVD